MFIYRRVDVAKNYNVVKTMPCLPPMTGNGKRSTYKNCDLADGLLLF